ncbi:recombinase B, partial [filamentous cyanobacterium CCP5]
MRFPAEVVTPTPHSPLPDSRLRWLTDDLLFHYQRCSRRTFLDLYGDAGTQDPPSDYLQKLKQDSAEHRRSIMQDYDPCRPVYPRGDWAAGARATEVMMAAGVEAIASGVLTTTASQDGVQLVSRPDLLVKLPGWSRWGDWLYAPIDIKLGKKPKLDYQIVALFHAYVLSRVQWAWPQ